MNPRRAELRLPPEVDEKMPAAGGAIASRSVAHSELNK